MFGRNGECPLPVIAAASPADCFDAALEACAHRRAVHDAGDAPLRRLPRQRLRALAAARRRRPADIPVEHPPADPEGFAPYRATTRRWPGPGPSRAPPGSSTASAASRRRTSPATSPTTRPTTSSMTALRAEKVERHRRASIRPLEVDGAAVGRPAGDRLGRHLRRDHRAAVERARSRAWQVSPRPPALPQPVARRTWARCWRASSRCWCPSSTSGQLAAAAARPSYLVDAVGLNKVQGKPFCPRSTRSSSRDRWMILGRRRRRWRMSVRVTLTPRRTSSPTRTCAGARAAATTRSSARCRRCCPSSASRARDWCSSPASAARSRFPYYMNTYGFHTIHGRAPAIATGLKTGAARPRRLGHHRRRRRAVDRRQPPDPRPAPQRRTSRSCCSTTASTA